MSNISITAYIVLALSIGYAFIYSPLGDITALMDQKQKYADSLEMVNNIENKKNELLGQYDKISADDKKNIDTVLPGSLGFVRLISEIDAVAATYGISIKSITSKEQSSSVGDSVDTAAAPKPYQSSIIGFSFDATYDKYGSFISALEKSMRIMDVRTTKITVSDKGINTYNVEFETYWLK